MSRAIHMLTLAATILVLAAAPAAAQVEWRTWNAGLKSAASSGRPVLVDVYTDWCSWCKRLDRDVYSRPDVSSYLNAHFVTIRLNAESGESVFYHGQAFTGRSLAGAFEVSGYPTTIFLAANGEHLANVPGYQEPDKFLLLLRYIGDGHMDRKESWQDYLAKAQGKH